MSLSEESIQSFHLNDNETLECEGVINKNELLKALPSMDNDKTPGNDSITKEIYVTFSNVFKEPPCASIQQSFLVN